MPASNYLSYKSTTNNSLNIFSIFNNIKDMLQDNRKNKLNKYLKNIKSNAKVIKNKQFKSKLIPTIYTTSQLESFKYRQIFYNKYYQKNTDEILDFKDKEISETYWINDLEVANVLWDIMKDKENEERDEAHRIAMEKKAELLRFQEETKLERERLRNKLQKQEKLKLQKQEELRLDRLEKEKIKKELLKIQQKKKQELKFITYQKSKIKQQAYKQKIFEDLETNHINRIQNEQLAISYYNRDIRIKKSNKKNTKY